MVAREIPSSASHRTVHYMLEGECLVHSHWRSVGRQRNDENRTGNPCAPSKFVFLGEESIRMSIELETESDTCRLIEWRLFTVGDGTERRARDQPSLIFSLWIEIFSDVLHRGLFARFLRRLVPDVRTLLRRGNRFRFGSDLALVFSIRWIDTSDDFSDTSFIYTIDTTSPSLWSAMILLVIAMRNLDSGDVASLWSRMTRYCSCRLGVSLTFNIRSDPFKDGSRRSTRLFEGCNFVRKISSNWDGSIVFSSISTIIGVSSGGVSKSVARTWLAVRCQIGARRFCSLNAISVGIVRTW